MLLDSLVNLPTALLALSGCLFYVFVYTLWLKRSTSQNIVIGGAAGAMPPLVGYASATGHLGWAAFVMFGIVFLWTPPHFWALALMIKEHYANANVPMLPVVRGDRETARQIVWYTVILVAATMLPVAFGVFGLVYGVAALALGALLAVDVGAAVAPDDAPAGGAACSTTRCSTSRCSSSRWPSTSPSDARARCSSGYSLRCAIGGIGPDGSRSWSPRPSRTNHRSNSCSDPITLGRKRRLPALRG